MRGNGRKPERIACCFYGGFRIHRFGFTVGYAGEREPNTQKPQHDDNGNGIKALSLGENVFRLTAVAKDGSTKAYKVTVISPGQHQ